MTGWCIAIFVLGLAIQGLHAQNVACAGKGSATVTLNSGSTFTYSTSGTTYSANQYCTANYQFGATCKQAGLTCSKFSTISSLLAIFVPNAFCSAGDYLQLTSGTTTRRFCGKAGPPPYSFTSPFSLTFVSDASKSSSGVTCKVSCTASSSGTGTSGSSTSSSSTCYCGLANRAKKIVGGQPTLVNEYPWQVGITQKTGTTFVFCGGSLISNQWVLTAAHCAAPINSNYGGAAGIQVLLGDDNYSITTETLSLRADASQVISHPSYVAKTTDYDFALIKLTNPIDFRLWPKIRPICLPLDDTNTYTGFNATISGWGTTSSSGSVSSKLRAAVVPVLSNSPCGSYPAGAITAQMLCAGLGGQDTCQGDSGGPLFTSGSGNGVTPGQNFQQIGITSWGYGCADARYPGVYSRVTKQLTWIRSAISGSTTCPRS